MRALAVIALALSSCAAVTPPAYRHLDPVCASEPYVPRSVEVLPARDLDAGPYVTDTGVRLPAERFDDFTAGEAPQP